MNDFLKMDIFFFVTTVVVVVFGVLGAYILWGVQKIVKNVEHITEQVAMESDLVRQDLSEMRSEIHHGKGRLKSLFGFLKKTTKRATKNT